VSKPGWSVERRPGAWVVCARLITDVRGVGHAFSTRRDGTTGADFDVGPADDASELHRHRRRALCRAAGLGDREPAVLEQEHGARVVAAQNAPARGDALVATAADEPRPVVSVRSADCAPLVVIAADGSAVAAIHAGWRGTAAGVVQSTLAALERGGVGPPRVVAAIGPTIGPCCYEVGPEVAQAVAERTAVPTDRLLSRTRAGGISLDLPGALALQLVAAGVPMACVTVAPWCTACHPDLFFSHRRDGSKTGRMMAVVGWTAGVP